MHHFSIESSARWYTSHIAASKDITSGIAAARVENHFNLTLATVSCMDLRQVAYDGSKQRHGRKASPSQQHFSTPVAARQPRSSPLPQSQWSDIPLPYRPRDWPDHADRLVPPTTSTEHAWRMRPAISGSSLSSTSIPTTSRIRQRPQSLQYPEIHSEPTEGQTLGPAHGRLQPSAYTYSIDHEPPRRAVSQPNSPPHFQQAFAEAEPPMLGIPRSPTYPPAGRRRVLTAQGSSDAAFDDEEDFRLFASATAGLGPELAFRDSLYPQAPSRLWVQSGSQFVPAPHGQGLSPIADSPSTMQAYAHLAQMPQAGEYYSAAQREMLQATAAGLDLWLHPPSATPAVSTTLTDDLDDNDELPPSDDELPNYAESQAQAQAGQRVEAARRAQELQRRWQARR